MSLGKAVVLIYHSLSVMLAYQERFMVILYHDKLPEMGKVLNQSAVHLSRCFK